MRLATLTVFDDWVQGAGENRYTSCELDHILALFDKFAIDVIVENADADGIFDVQIETSGDGRNWIGKQSLPEISAATIVAGGVTQAVGVETGDLGSLPFVRLRIQIVTTESAYFRIFVTGRDRGFTKKQQSDCEKWQQQKVTQHECLATNQGASGACFNEEALAQPKGCPLPSVYHQGATGYSPTGDKK